MAKHHVLLRQVFANTNFVRTDIDSFNHFSTRFFHSFNLLSVISSSLRRASVSISEVVCPTFLELDFPPVEGSELPCAPVQCSFSASIFKGLGTSVPEAECGCCWLYQFFFNVTQGASLGVSSLSKFSRSPFLRCHTINTISRYCSLSHDCK